MNNKNWEPSLVDPDLVNRISTSYGIEVSLATRIIEDVLLSYSKTLEEYIRSRHIQLQKMGYKNTQIYAMIQQEVQVRRFAAEPLSLRQIRRYIYG